MLARPAQHDDAHRVVVGGAHEQLVQRVGHLGVLGIAEAGPVHGQHGDGAALLIEHRLLGLVDDIRLARFDQIRHVTASAAEPAVAGGGRP